MAAEGRRVINAACHGYGTLILINHGKIFSVTTVRELGFEFSSSGRQQCIPQQQCLTLLIPSLGIFHALHL